jgi:hypothetical protein
VILAIIVVWGLTHLFNISTEGWFTNFFSNSPSITITAPKTATSSEPFTVSWKYAQPTKGNFALLYGCTSGAQLAILQSDAQINVACGKAFTVSATDKLSLLPTLTGTNQAHVPLSILFVPSATGTKAESGVTIAINPSSGTTAQTPTMTQQVSQTTTSTPRTTTRSSSQGVHANGPADLSVRIVEVGTIDPSTGEFIDRAPTPYDIAAVKFDISNVGGTATGPWYFSADLPTQSGYAYTSPQQASLAPGAHILNTLRFNEIIPGGTFTVTVDPNGAIRESTKANNTAAVTVGY